MYHDITADRLIHKSVNRGKTSCSYKSRCHAKYYPATKTFLPRPHTLRGRTFALLPHYTGRIARHARRDWWDGANPLNRHKTLIPLARRSRTETKTNRMRFLTLRAGSLEEWQIFRLRVGGGTQFRIAMYHRHMHQRPRPIIASRVTMIIAPWVQRVTSHCLDLSKHSGLLYYYTIFTYRTKYLNVSLYSCPVFMIN